MPIYVAPGGGPGYNPSIDPALDHLISLNAPGGAGTVPVGTYKAVGHEIDEDQRKVLERLRNNDSKSVTLGGVTFAVYRNFAQQGRVDEKDMFDPDKINIGVGSPRWQDATDGQPCAICLEGAPKRIYKNPCQCPACPHKPYNLCEDCVKAQVGTKDPKDGWGDGVGKCECMRQERLMTLMQSQYQ